MAYREGRQNQGTLEGWVVSHGVVGIVLDTRIVDRPEIGLSLTYVSQFGVVTKGVAVQKALKA
jgi:hypothetical protein